LCVIRNSIFVSVNNNKGSRGNVVG
jgi:hypothetical protein